MKKRKLNLKERTIDLLKSLCFLSPSLLGVGVFFIVPFGVVVYYSLIDGVGSKNFVFLQNFIKLFDNSAFLMAAKNTLSFSAVAVPLAVVLAILVAVVIYAVLIIALRAISKHDLALMPKGEKIAKILHLS